MSEAGVVPEVSVDYSTDNKISLQHTLIVGDSRKIHLDKYGPFHLVVTSPPYGTIKDYGNQDQIGFKQELNNYINDLLKVWRKCHRVLEPGCRMVINIGDQYIRSSKGTPYHIIPLHSMIVNSIINDRSINDMIYLGSIIWKKISTTKTSGGGTVMGSYPYPRSVYPCFENEYIAIFRKLGKTRSPEHIDKSLSKMEITEWREVTSGVWEFPGSRMEEHPAAFPELLPYRLIKMFTFAGERILDPFVGTGTTMSAAVALGRNSVGIDIGFKTRTGKPFQEVVEEKVISKEKPFFVDKVKFEIINKSRN